MTNLRELPPAAAHAVTAETQGEIVRWVSRPSPSANFWRTTPIWLMGIPWLAFSGGMFGAFALGLLYGTPKVTVKGPAGWESVGLSLALVFIGVFVLIGLAMFAAPFWVWWKSRRMVFVVTDKRLLRIGWGRGGARQVKSFNPARFVAIDRKQKSDGSGTLVITTLVTRDSDGDAAKETEMLVGVADVATADRLLTELMERGSAGGGVPAGGSAGARENDRATPRDKAA